MYLPWTACRHRFSLVWGGIYLSLAGDIFFAIAIVKIRHAELFLLLIKSP